MNRCGLYCRCGCLAFAASAQKCSKLPRLGFSISEPRERSRLELRSFSVFELLTPERRTRTNLLWIV